MPNRDGVPANPRKEAYTSSATVQLRHPDLETGERIESITLRRPRARDLKAAVRQAGGSATPIEIDIALFSQLAELPPETIGALDLSDFGALQDAYAGFLSRAD